MPKIKYVDQTFASKSVALIKSANEIINEYAAQGYDLTLRQLYYQFVARDILENTQKEYKRLGAVINDARMAGLIDWNSITDRTRNLRRESHWDGPKDIIDACAQSYHIDFWASQDYRPEVWIEKDALVGVLDVVCPKWDVPYFSCRGYTSQSEMWSAAMRLKSYKKEGKTPIVFHLGDHDPSGIDMSRDIAGRLEIFIAPVEVKRIALNMDQVREFNPPPNPAKTTDSRFADYEAKFGDESWELDALDPATITTLIETEILWIRNKDLWEESEATKAEGKRLLTAVAAKWDKLTRKL